MTQPDNYDPHAPEITTHIRIPRKQFMPQLQPSIRQSRNRVSDKGAGSVSTSLSRPRSGRLQRCGQIHNHANGIACQTSARSSKRPFSRSFSRLLSRVLAAYLTAR